ncbi:MAG: FAD-dependent oxidoreductase, partial [Pseudomonadota bacterium]
LEPNVECDAAILSPSSGIIDSHTLMLTLIGDIEDAGGAMVLSSPIVGGRVSDDGIALDIGGEEPMSLSARLVVNCSGLYADQIARSIEGLDSAKIPTIRPAKGQYFTYSGKTPFHRLIYPLHSRESQGVHYSRDLGGGARLGPDITWDAPLGDYSVDEGRLDYFADGVSRFWPNLDRSRLQPGYAGQRPKTAGPGEEGDFMFVGPADHGTPGYLGLYGIESPGLTSCLAIGGHVSAMVRAF